MEVRSEDYTIVDNDARLAPSSADLSEDFFHSSRYGHVAFDRHCILRLAVGVFRRSGHGGYTVALAA